MAGVGIGITPYFRRGGNANSYLLSAYPGAAIAFSVRKINSTATNCVRLRRSSDNAELNFGFVAGLVDIASIETWAAATNAFVVKFFDQSGNGNDLVQNVAANQPQMVSAGSVILKNGKPSIYYDGTGKTLTLSSTVSGLVPWSVSIVTSRHAATDIGPCLSNTSVGADSPFTCAFYLNGATYSSNRVTYDIDGPDGLSTGTNQKICGIAWSNNSGVSPTWYNMGVQQVPSGTLAAARSLDFGCIGVISFEMVKGYHQEEILYSANKAAEILAIQTNQNAFFGAF